MNKPKLENNSLLQLVEGLGGFGMFLDDKIVVGNTLIFMLMYHAKWW